MRSQESFDLARGLLVNQRPKCPRCSEMMVVQLRGTELLWVCVRVGRCLGTKALDQAKFRRWAHAHGVVIPSPSTLTQPRASRRDPLCPKCDSDMKRRINKAQGSEFWGCIEYPACRGVVPIQSRPTIRAQQSPQM